MENSKEKVFFIMETAMSTKEGLRITKSTEREN